MMVAPELSSWYLQIVVIISAGSRMFTENAELPSGCDPSL